MKKLDIYVCQIEIVITHLMLQKEEEAEGNRWRASGKTRLGGAPAQRLVYLTCFPQILILIYLYI